MKYPGYLAEGQPVSIIEDMAYGRVVISTDYRAIPDLVVDGVLIEHGRPYRMADAMRRIVGDPRRYEAMSSAACKHYARRFTMQRRLDAIVPLLEGA